MCGWWVFAVVATVRECGCDARSSLMGESVLRGGGWERA